MEQAVNYKSNKYIEKLWLEIVFLYVRIAFLHLLYLQIYRELLGLENLIKLPNYDKNK